MKIVNKRLKGRNRVKLGVALVTQGQGKVELMCCTVSAFYTNLNDFEHITKYLKEANFIGHFRVAVKTTFLHVNEY